MTHLPSILWLLTWPLLIFATYKAALYALIIFQKHNETTEQTELNTEGND